MHPRNEPCLCGSNIKYKKCCGTPAALAESRRVAFRAAIEKRRVEREAREAKLEAERDARGQPSRLPRMSASQMLGITAMLIGGMPMSRR